MRMPSDFVCRTWALLACVTVCLGWSPWAAAQEARDNSGDAVRIGDLLFRDKIAFVDSPLFRESGARCATGAPPPFLCFQMQQRLRKFCQVNDSTLKDLPTITIPVRFHVIHAGERGKLSEEVLRDQLKALEFSYAPHGFRYTQESVDYTDNETWFRMPFRRPAHPIEVAAKDRLGKDQRRAASTSTRWELCPSVGRRFPGSCKIIAYWMVS